MKRKFLHAILLATAVIGLSSCGDDDDGPSNYFTFNGTTKGVTGLGTLTIDDSAGEINGKSVYFHHIQFGNGELKVGAKISSIDFSVSSYTKEIPAGTYTFSGKDNTGKDFEITDGSVYMDIDIANLDFTNSYDFASGSATIAISGDTYTIDATGTASKSGDTVAQEFKIHYSGKLEEF